MRRAVGRLRHESPRPSPELSPDAELLVSLADGHGAKARGLYARTGVPSLRHIWNEWFVAYKPDDAEFERTAAAFDNPDWADVTLHSYRSRWGHADGDPRYAELEARFNPVPTQRVPTLTLHGALDPVNSPQMSEGKEAYFIGPYERRLIDGSGHFPQRECAADTASQVIDWLGRYC